MMKSAMCYLQGTTNFKDIITSLPHDVQVLTLLSIGKQNITGELFFYCLNCLVLPCTIAEGTCVVP
jgi:hypothetical protein